MLAAIAAHYHWSRAELEALDAPTARFWHNAAAALHERVREENGG